MLAPVCSSDPRLISRSLSGFLCGTHSGALVSRRGDRLVDGPLLAGLRGCAEPHESRVALELGARGWEASPAAAPLAERLALLLDAPEIVDLIIFGSHARDSTTGFSDIDAILVLDESAIHSVGVLRSLRRRVLGAQRAVLAYQPMQHHGFEVVTLDLLHRADEALAMPREALLDTRSLYGTCVEARFAEVNPLSARATLGRMVTGLASIAGWPTHPWCLHGTISMFELLPVLYLQARGIASPKSKSFDLARDDFGRDWWPYDELARVRAAWPRRRRRSLEAAAAVVRNPWLAVAMWSRLPVSPPLAAKSLSPDCLPALQSLTCRMAE